MPGSEWFMSLAGALLISAGAVALFVVLIGLVILPAEAGPMFDPFEVSITHSALQNDGQSAVSTLWAVPRGGNGGWHNYIGIHDLTSPRPQLKVAWTEIDPKCLVAISPRCIAVGGWDGSISIVDPTRPTDGSKLIGQQIDDCPQMMARSHDGKKLLSLGPYWLHCWDLASRKLLWAAQGRFVNCLAVHPRCGAVVCGMTDGSIVELDVLTGDELRRFRNQSSLVHCVTISADGKKLASLSEKGRIECCDWVTGKVLWEQQCIAPHRIALNNCRECSLYGTKVALFSPASDAFVFAAMEGHEWNLLVCDPESGERRHSLRGHTKAIHGAAFSAEGNLLSWGADGTVRVWNLATGEQRSVISPSVRQAG